MKELTLSQGEYGKVSDVDFPRCFLHKWYLQVSNGKKYAAARIDGNIVSLHRFVMNAGKGDPDVDHKDGDGLNCQRYNLRFATSQQNSANAERKPGVSGFKGVRPSGKKWRAEIKNNGVLEHLGVFDTPQQAARMYDAYAKMYYGKEFARTNF